MLKCTRINIFKGGIADIMEDFGFVTSFALISNLEGLAKEYSVIGEQRLLELGEIAREVALRSEALFSEGLSPYEVLSVISESLNFGVYSLSELNSSENSDALQTSLGTLSMIDKAIFAGLYISELHGLGVRLPESEFLDEGNRAETFTYVRNAFSDEAYDVFSQDFADPRLKYSSSFKECVSLIEAGEITYCLLPLEERGGVRLPSIAELLFRNDLKINSVTPVFGPDGTADMKYALVSKHFTIPKRNSEDDRYLELRLGAMQSFSLGELLFVLDYFSMSVYRVNTISFDNEGETDTYYSLVIRDGKDGFVPLLTYLTLFCEDFVPVGIYKNLE